MRMRELEKILETCLRVSEGSVSENKFEKTILAYIPLGTKFVDISI
jgi:hypothetical protein